MIYASSGTTMLDIEYTTALIVASAVEAKDLAKITFIARYVNNDV